MPKRHNFKTYMEKDGISFQPKMSTNKQIKVRTQVLCKDLRYPAFFHFPVCELPVNEDCKFACYQIAMNSDGKTHLS